MPFNTIRYSESFKRQVVGEMECGKWSSASEAQAAYGVRGSLTVMNWVRKYGSPSIQVRKVVVMHPSESSENAKLQRRIRELERAVADAKVAELLERTFLELACEKGGLGDAETFKKKVAMKRATTADLPTPR